MPDQLELIGLVIGSTSLILGVYAIILHYYIPDKLELYAKDNPFEDATVANGQPPATNRFYHLTVRNNHKNAMAKNCKPYLISMRKIEGKELVSTPIPLKWRGFPTSIVDINPKKEQRFDAFHISLGNTLPISFNAYIDSTAMIPIANFPGEYEAIYRVTSDNFKTKEGSFIITLSVNTVEVNLRQKV